MGFIIVKIRLNNFKISKMVNFESINKSLLKYREHIEQINILQLQIKF